MEQLSPDHNPFMLMTHPEVVIAAMEKSERLSQLRRQLCRPLDRPVPGTAPSTDDDEDAGDTGCDQALGRD